jgi:hypothetical protein
MKPTSPIRFLLSNRAPWSSYSLRRRHPSGRVDLGDTSKIDAGFAAAIKMHFTNLNSILMASPTCHPTFINDDAIDIGNDHGRSAMARQRM